MVRITPPQRILADLPKHKRAGGKESDKEPTQFAFPAERFFLREGAHAQFFNKKVSQYAP